MPALVAALPGLFAEVAASAAAANPTAPDLLAFSAEDVMKLMAERDASDDQVTKLQERRREAERRLVQLGAKIRAQEGDMRVSESRALDTERRTAQAEQEVLLLERELCGSESRARRSLLARS